MKNIQRYTKGKFGRIEKHDSGEFVYWHDVENELSKIMDKVNILEKQIELNYKLASDLVNPFELAKDLSDKLIQSKLSSKKYRILMLMHIFINIGLLSYLWMN